MEVSLTGGTQKTVVDLAAGQTRVWRNALADLLGVSAAAEGALMLRPVTGELTASAWLTSGNGESTTVTTLPVVPLSSAIGLGVTRSFFEVADFSAASLQSKVYSAVTPSLGLVETAGASATIEVTVSYAQGYGTAAVRQTRAYSLAASSVMLIDDVVSEVVGSSRDKDPDLYRVTIQVKVSGGGGKVLPYLLVRAASTGDRIIRVR